MGGGGRSSSSQTYNSVQNTHVDNKNLEANQITTTTDNFQGDKVDNERAFKINVMGGVGQGARIFLLNLNDVTPV